MTWQQRRRGVWRQRRRIGATSGMAGVMAAWRQAGETPHRGVAATAASSMAWRSGMWHHGISNLIENQHQLKAYQNGVAAASWQRVAHHINNGQHRNRAASSCAASTAWRAVALASTSASAIGGKSKRQRQHGKASISNDGVAWQQQTREKAAA